jgi:hypothetical protein
MDHLTPRSLAGVRIDLPCLRRGGQLACARGGASVAQWLPVAAHRGRAAGLLHAEQGFGIELVAGRRML